jgi:hypothetical protein
VPSAPPTSTTRSRPSRSAYFEATRTGTYGFLSVVPLLVLYEVMIAVANTGSAHPVRISSEVWLKQIVALMGGTGLWVLTGLVVAIGAGILFLERKKNVPIRASYFAGIMAESAIYAIVVAALVSQMVAAVLLAAPGPQPQHNLWTQLALSIGAGIYEELVFRVLLVGGLFWLLQRMTSGRTAAYVIAAVAGALLFSFVHYTGAFGDPFAVDSFAFRFLFGLALNVLFLLRGFGVAAWTHALYDVYFTLGVFG